MERKPRLLIVEDEPALRYLLRLVLSRDFEVDQVSDGEEALEYLAARSYDLVLLDVMLPGRDGYSLCEEIRQLPGGDRPKIAFCTARGGIGGRARGREVGGEDYIVKPFSPSALLERLKLLVGQQYAVPS